MGYDYNTKMKEIRDQWKAVSVISTSMNLHENDVPYFKAMASMATGKRLLDFIEDKQDVNVMETFSNKIPRLGFERHDVLDLQSNARSEDISNLCNKALDLLDERAKEMREAREAAAEGDDVKTQYHLSREYAMSFYLRGLWQIISVLQTGYKPMHWMEALK